MLNKFLFPTRMFSFSKKEVVLLLSIFIGFFICVCFPLTLWKYNTLRSNWPFDLAFHNHVFWNLVHGSKFITLTPGAGVNGPYIFKQDHFSLIRFLLVPFYFLSPGIKTLFFMQVFIISLGIVGAYLLGRFYTKDDFMGIGFSLVYIFFVPIFNLAVYDFNPLCLCIPFVIFTFYFYLKKDLVRFIIFALLTLSVREELMLSIALLGIIALFRKEKAATKIKWFLCPLGLSLGWFILYFFYRTSYYTGNFIWLSWLKSLFLSYLSASNFFCSLKNVGAFLYRNYSVWLILGLLSPQPLFASLFNFLYLLLINRELASGPYCPVLKYTAVITSFMFISCALTLGKIYNYLSRKKKLLNTLVLVCCLVFLGVWWMKNLLLIINYPPKFLPAEVKKLHNFVKKIDTKDVVLTSHLLTPLFSSRKEIYCYQELEPHFSWEGVWKRLNYIIVEKEHREILKILNNLRGIQKIEETENFLLYKKINSKFTDG